MNAAADRGRPVPAQDLATVTATRHIVVCTGAGGVGKTTTAAALAVRAARGGRRTIVLTIDPARRLAQALGLTELENRPRPVDGVDGLDAMMLDMKRTFDDVIDRYAFDSTHAQRIKTNRFYHQLSNSLGGTQEYMAMEKLYELHNAGAYDCIVVDTPPTRNALDFLDAPRRLTDFLEGRFLRMFLQPGISAGKRVGRAVGLGASLFMKAAARITGAGVLGDLAEFFQSFEGMYEGFKERAQATYALLQRPDTAFVVVATPDTPALREARYFLERLERDRMPTAGLVVNRVSSYPPELPGGKAAVHEALARLTAEGERNGHSVAVLAAAGLLRLHADRQTDARREQHAVAAALANVDPVALVTVPLMPGDIHDLAGLEEVGAYLCGEAFAPALGGREPDRGT